jgi:Lar family restriction alleviation protein
MTAKPENPRSEELRPCPFCGGKGALCVLEGEPGEFIGAWVNCSCGAETREQRTEREAIIKWNTRSVLVQTPSAEKIAQFIGRSRRDLIKNQQDLIDTQQKRINAIREALQAVANYMRKDVQSGDSDLWTEEYTELHDTVIAALASSPPAQADADRILIAQAGAPPGDAVRKALELCIEELEESLENEGRLASFKAAIEKGRAALAFPPLADHAEKPSVDFMFQAAERANKRFGKWMPQQWLEIFIDEMVGRS